VKLCLVTVSAFPDIVKDCPRMRNDFPKKFLECGPSFLKTSIFKSKLIDKKSLVSSALKEISYC